MGQRDTAQDVTSFSLFSSLCYCRGCNSRRRTYRVLISVSKLLEEKVRFKCALPLPLIYFTTEQREMCARRNKKSKETEFWEVGTFSTVQRTEVFHSWPKMVFAGLFWSSLCWSKVTWLAQSCLLRFWWCNYMGKCSYTFRGNKIWGKQHINCKYFIIQSLVICLFL